MFTWSLFEWIGFITLITLGIIVLNPIILLLGNKISWIIYGKLQTKRRKKAIVLLKKSNFSPKKIRSLYKLLNKIDFNVRSCLVCSEAIDYNSRCQDKKKEQSCDSEQTWYFLREEIKKYLETGNPINFEKVKNLI